MGGIACCAEARKVKDDELVPKDLPQPSIEGKDALTAFELKVPFARTSLSAFLKRIKAANAESGSEGLITLEILRKHFPTAAWEPLADAKSQLSQLLLNG